MTQLIKEQISLKELTTFKIGGNARYFAAPNCIDEFLQAIDFAKAHNVRYFFLGGGANCLVPDSGVDGLVIYTGNLSGITVDGTHITAECGLSVDKLVEKAADSGLSGLEFAYGLPGSVGGAAYMNARCYGSEFADVVESVTAVECGTNEIITLSKDEIKYQYKSSIFMSRDDLFILRVTFSLKSGDKSQILQNSQANKADRQTKGQYEYPSAGCVFKNNYEIGIPVGKLIQEAGLKNRQIGGAKVYDKHANFIINSDNATASDVLDLIDVIQTDLSKRGYKLERELKILGVD